MGVLNKGYKTLKLKYGEYYSLKITDSSKNIINNIEITGSQISTIQQVFSEATYSDRVACRFFDLYVSFVPQCIP